MCDKSLAQLKVALYRELLLKMPNEITDTEVEIAYHLTFDKDIQKKLKNDIGIRSYGD